MGHTTIFTLTKYSFAENEDGRTTSALAANAARRWSWKACRSRQTDFRRQSRDGARRLFLVQTRNECLTR